MNLLEFYQRELKGLPLMASVLATLGINVPASRTIHNQTYHDTKPSVYVYPDSLRDFGSGESYDPIDVLQKWGQLNFRESVVLLSQLAGRSVPDFPEVALRFTPRVAPALQAKPKIDPHVFSDFAVQAHEAFNLGQSDEAKAIIEYLESRGLITVPHLLGLGVVDASVKHVPPGFKRGMLSIPSWYENKLRGVKGRNTQADKALREYRNLAGASVPAYNLENALNLEQNYLYIVEGEIDTLSVLEAWDMEVAVIGIPGTNNWKQNLNPELIGSKRLYVALDGDNEGVKTTHEIMAWSRLHGIPAYGIDTGPGDKNEALQRLGRDGFRDHLHHTIRQSVGRTSQRISRALR